MRGIYSDCYSAASAAQPASLTYILNCAMTAQVQSYPPTSGLHPSSTKSTTNKLIMDAPAARRPASGRAQLLNGLRRPSQLEQQEFIVSCTTPASPMPNNASLSQLQQQQATIDQLARLQAQTEQIFAQMDMNGAHPSNNREAISNNMQNMTRTRRLSSNPPSTNHLRLPNTGNNNTFKGRRPASLNLSALKTSTPIHEEKEALSLHPSVPHTATQNPNTHRNNANKRKTYSNLGHLPPVPQSAPANGRNTSFRIPSALNSANSNTPQGCVRQPRGPPSENLESVNFSSRQRKLASRRLSGLANIAEARRRVSVVPNDDSIDPSNCD